MLNYGRSTDVNGRSRFLMLQDEEIVRLAHGGDSLATECLLGRYRSLVVAKARTYFVVGADREDVVQEGMIGLYKAIRDYRGDRSTRFRPFAEMCVTRQIITAVKAATRFKHLPLNGSLELESAGFWIGTQPKLGADGLLSTAMQALSPLERGVLEGFLNGKSYLEMSHELSCHTKSVDNALQRAKRKLGTYLLA